MFTCKLSRVSYPHLVSGLPRDLKSFTDAKTSKSAKSYKLIPDLSSSWAFDGIDKKYVSKIKNYIKISEERTMVNKISESSIIEAVETTSNAAGSSEKQSLEKNEDGSKKSYGRRSRDSGYNEEANGEKKQFTDLRQLLNFRRERKKKENRVNNLEDLEKSSSEVKNDDSKIPDSKEDDDGKLKLLSLSEWVQEQRKFQDQYKDEKSYELQQSDQEVNVSEDEKSASEGSDLRNWLEEKHNKCSKNKSSSSTSSPFRKSSTVPIMSLREWIEWERYEMDHGEKQLRESSECDSAMEEMIELSEYLDKWEQKLIEQEKEVNYLIKILQKVVDNYEDDIKRHEQSSITNENIELDSDQNKVQDGNESQLTASSRTSERTISCNEFELNSSSVKAGYTDLRLVLEEKRLKKEIDQLIESFYVRREKLIKRISENRNKSQEVESNRQSFDEVQDSQTQYSSSQRHSESSHSSTETSYLRVFSSKDEENTRKYEANALNYKKTKYFINSARRKNTF